MWREQFLLVFFVYCSSAKPFISDDQSSSREDIAAVESLRRDVRQPVPLAFATEVEDLLSEGNAPKKSQTAKTPMKNAAGKSDEGGYFKSYGSDAEGEKGYLQETHSKGNHGYKTLDTFHKQDGDKYAFEKHLAYGKAHDDEKSSHKNDGGSHSKKTGDHEGAGTIVDSHYAVDGGDDHTNEGGDHESYAHDDGTHYVDHGPESSSYGHSASYTAGNGDDGSYERQRSYSRSHDGSHGDHKGHYY